MNVIKDLVQSINEGKSNSQIIEERLEFLNSEENQNKLKHQFVDDTGIVKYAEGYVPEDIKVTGSIRLYT